jgi:hypothetical protein
MDIRVPSLLNYATQAACEVWWQLSYRRSGRADRRPQVESRHQATQTPTKREGSGANSGVRSGTLVFRRVGNQR